MAAERDRIESMVVERNDALVEARLASATRTFGAKIRKRQQWLAEATNDRIRRMRAGEIQHLEAQLRDRLRDIEAKREVFVTYELLMGGVLSLTADPSVEVVAASVPEPAIRGPSPCSRRGATHVQT